MKKTIRILLMFKKDIDYGLLFILKYGSSIHTCFMRFTIDIYFLDENKIVFDKVIALMFSFLQMNCALFVFSSSHKIASWSSVNLVFSNSIEFILSPIYFMIACLVL